MDEKQVSAIAVIDDTVDPTLPVPFLDLSLCGLAVLVLLVVVGVGVGVVVVVVGVVVGVGSVGSVGGVGSVGSVGSVLNCGPRRFSVRSAGGREALDRQGRRPAGWVRYQKDAVHAIK